LTVICATCILSTPCQSVKVSTCILCVDAGGPEPPKLLLPTTDYLYNMTARNISKWLVKTTMDYLKKRSLGIFCTSTFYM